ncbi:PEP-CTERM sorting domain-containing protein [Opitutaceae bacterium TAV4]|nr:PEP-CTERM sorting domain-containing protein [Opitutaceae bacterium TAV4]RRK00605.1 PEP-CTERM sorting domain-containing protein [Opitutaceae bacterium TAV3]
MKKSIHTHYGVPHWRTLSAALAAAAALPLLSPSAARAADIIDGAISGDAVVTISGTEATTTGDLTIGGGSTGTLNITNGGVLSIAESHNIVVGIGTGSNGILNIDNGTLQTTGGNMHVGYTTRNSMGTLTITNGSMVAIDGAVILGRGGNTRGTVTVSNSTLQVGANLSSWVGANTLDITDGGLVSANTVDMAGSINSDGSSVSIFTVTSGTLQSASTIVIGGISTTAHVATLNIGKEGLVTADTTATINNQGRIEFTLGASGDNGLLEAASLTIVSGGVVSFVGGDGFVAEDGASWQVFDLVTGITGDSLANLESGLSLFGLGEGYAWDTSLLGSAGILSIVTTAVPEPATYAALAGLAMLAYVIVRRRR